MKMVSSENDYFIYEMFYTNLMVTTKHKSKRRGMKHKRKLRKSYKTIKLKKSQKNTRKKE